MDKKTAIVIGAAMTFGFLADVVQYSMGKSKGGPFRLYFPTGHGLRTILAVVIVEAIAIDFAMNKLDKALATKEENDLKELAKTEAEKLKLNPELKGNPAIVWIPKII